jgi:hypothetical protein
MMTCCGRSQGQALEFRGEGLVRSTQDDSGENSVSVWRVLIRPGRHNSGSASISKTRAFCREGDRVADVNGEGCFTYAAF